MLLLRWHNDHYARLLTSASHAVPRNQKPPPGAQLAQAGWSLVKHGAAGRVTGGLLRDLGAGVPCTRLALVVIAVAPSTCSWLLSVCCIDCMAQLKSSHCNGSHVAHAKRRGPNGNHISLPDAGDNAAPRRLDYCFSLKTIAGPSFAFLLSPFGTMAGASQIRWRWP